jgi:hypothetical protein
MLRKICFDLYPRGLVGFVFRQLGSENSHCALDTSVKREILRSAELSYPCPRRALTSFGRVVVEAGANIGALTVAVRELVPEICTGR